MFVSKYIKIIFVISIIVFISVNIPCLYAQETTEIQAEKPEHEHQHEHEQESNKAHEQEHQHEHEHEHGHQHEHEDYDPTGEHATFGRDTNHDHEHNDCEYFTKAWRQPGTIDIMKKYTFIVFALFGIIAIYKIIANNVKKQQILKKNNYTE